MSGDETAIEPIAENLLALNAEQILDRYAVVDNFIGEVEAELAPARQEREYLRKAIELKLAADNASALVTDAYEVEIITTTPTDEKREDVLRELLTVGGIPQAALDKAICLVPQPAKLKTHLTALRKLEKYGAKVQDILKRGIVPAEPRKSLFIRRVEKRVQPTAIEGR